VTPPAERGAFGRVMRAGSLALGYPDPGWRQHLPLLQAAAGAITGPARTHLRSFLDEIAGTAPGQLQQAYVETFDLRRRCSPYLTYYSCGDTRKRGMALLQFTAAYRAAGFELAKGAGEAGGELPDHLAVLCEFTAAARLMARTPCRGPGRRAAPAVLPRRRRGAGTARAAGPCRPS